MIFGPASNSEKYSNEYNPLSQQKVYYIKMFT